MTNATGWAELYDGRVIDAAFTLYNTATFGWAVGALLMVFEIMLLIKTKNPPAVLISTLIFIAIYIGAVKAQVAGLLILLALVSLAGILYLVFTK